MKREGRQHGMVKTYPILSAPWDPRPRPWAPNRTSSTPTTGLFAKVPTKPTNHSKFTSKCGRPMCRECHSSPTSKSKDKAKGAQRLRSSSGTMAGLRLSGFSIMSILSYLDGDDDCMDQYYGGDGEEYYKFIQVEESNYEISSPSIDIEEVVECKTKDDWINGDDNEDISFSDKGFGWQLEDGDEDWYLV